MGQRGIIGVVAAFIAFHFDTGEAVLVNRKTSHLDFAQVDLDGNRGEAMGTRAFFLEVCNVIIGQIDDVA